MFNHDAPIPWDKLAELFAVEADLRVDRKAMTLRQAVEIFRDSPPDERKRMGVGIHDPVLMYFGEARRPVAVGFLNASSLEVLARLV